MKLYKFRSLRSCEDLTRAQEILETGRFWCSRFWELNDPMEGVYWFHAGTLTDEFIRTLYGEKSKHAICSFSGERAFSNPLMWGYYANGFKGIAIEVDVDCPGSSIEKMYYASEVVNIKNNETTDAAVKRILTTKLCCWAHEDEYRYLRQGGNGLHEIGTITAVHFGVPYKTIINAEDAQRRPRVREYLCRVKSLEQTAKDQGISCSQVDIEDGRVSCRGRTSD